MIELPGDSRRVTIDGINTHYVEAGAGRPLLLFHGLGASVATWRDNIGPLARSFRVVAVDLPGHGDSEKPNIDYHPAAMVRFIASFAEATGLDRPAVIGNSVGGALGLMTALKHPDLVSGLVLVDSASLGRDVSLYIRLVSVPLLGEVLESSKIGGSRFMLKHVFHDPSFATPELVDELYRSHRMRGAKEAVVRVIRRTVSLLGVRDEYVLTDRLESLPIPTMVVWGANDRIFPVSQAYHSSASSPRTTLHVFDDCGHWPHMEKADAFNAAVVNFLSP